MVTPKPNEEVAERFVKLLRRYRKAEDRRNKPLERAESLLGTAIVVAVIVLYFSFIAITWIEKIHL